MCKSKLIRINSVLSTLADGLREKCLKQNASNILYLDQIHIF